MTPRSKEADFFDRSIYSDEVGLEVGVCGAFRIKTTFQPVYGGKVDDLAVVFVHAGHAVQRNGRPATVTELIERQRMDPGLLQRLATRLALGNLRNCDVDDANLYLKAPLAAYKRAAGFAADVRHLAKIADELEIDARRIVAELDCTAKSLDQLVEMSAVLRRHGVGVALVHARADDPLNSWITAVQPRIIRIEAGWLRRMDRHVSSRSLLKPLVHTMQDQGIRVLFEGLDSAESLAIADDAGADYLQGDALHETVLAGMLIDQSIAPGVAARRASNVIPLHRLVKSDHQH